MNRFKIVIIGIATLTLVSCVNDLEPGVDMPNTGESYVDDSNVVEGWVRIKLQESAKPLRVGMLTRGESIASGNEELDRIAQELGAVEVSRVFSDGGRFAERRRKYGFHLWYDIRFDETLPVSRATSMMDGIDGVAIAQPIHKVILFDNEPGLPGEVVYSPVLNEITRAAEMPFNDPELNKQWHYSNDGSMQRSVAGSDANVFKVWERVTGHKDVIVAVTDGGIDYSHPDIEANMWVNLAEKNGTTDVDDDNNGYVDDIYGWNGVRRSGVINPLSHGTHVAGTVAAVNNNGIGVAGVAGGNGTANSGIKLMSCQAFDSGTSDARAYADGYLYAADNGAVISQNSWGYNNTVGEIPQEVTDAMDYFIANAGIDEMGVQTGPMKGGVMLFATGNDGAKRVALPASDERVLAVTAMSSDFTPGRYTNFGPEADIFAPGGADTTDPTYFSFNSVYSTDINNTYSYKHGTSMACPHASGVAALIVAEYGTKAKGFTAKMLKERLLRSVKPLNPKYVGDRHYNYLGSGMLDANMMFIENTNKKPAVVTEPQSKSNKNVVTLSWIVPADGDNLAVTKFVVGYKSTSVGKFVGVYPDASGELMFSGVTAVGERASFTYTGSYNTKYDFEVFSVDRFGNTSSSGVKFSSTVGDFTNAKPRISTRFDALEIAESGEEHKVSYNLTNHFSDANIVDGDVLKYTFINRNEQCVSVVIDSDNKLIITPIAKGTVNVSITATDLSGEQILSSLPITVLSGEPPVVVTGELSLFPTIATSILNITAKGWNSVSSSISVVDAAARVVSRSIVALDSGGKGSLDVSKLTPGVYTLVLRSGEKQLRGSFVKQ